MNNGSFCSQNIYLENRKKLELSGILDVSAFSENFIEAEYSEGCIAVEGVQLKIEEFSNEFGTLKVNGTITAMYYYNKIRKSKKKSFHK